MRDEHQRAIGALIARLREQQGWSQRALAKWVGIDQSAVSRIEAGHRRLAADELQRFADVLHVSADDLLRGLPCGAVPAWAGAGARLCRRAAAGRNVPLLPLPAHPGNHRARRCRLASGGRARPPTPDLSGVPGDPGPRTATFAAPRMRRSSAPEDWRESASPSPHPDLGALDAEQAQPSLSHALRIDAAGAMRTSPSAGLPDEVAGVARDWFELRRLSASASRRSRGAPATRPRARRSVSRTRLRRCARVRGRRRALRSRRPLLAQRAARRSRRWPSSRPRASARGRLRRPGDRRRVVGAAGDRPVAAAFTTGGRTVPLRQRGPPGRAAALRARARVRAPGARPRRRRRPAHRVEPQRPARGRRKRLRRGAAGAGARRAALVRAPGAIALGAHGDLLELGNAFGISAWAALYRSRAAGRLHGKQFSALRADLERHEWQLLPRQAYLGGLKDTLSQLTPGEALPQGAYGAPAVLRVPAPMRAWTLDRADGRPPEPRGRGRPAAPRRRGACGAASPHGPRVAAPTSRRQRCPGASPPARSPA